MKQPAEFSDAAGSGKMMQRIRSRRDWTRHYASVWLILLPIPFLLRSLLADALNGSSKSTSSGFFLSGRSHFGTFPIRSHFPDRAGCAFLACFTDNLVPRCLAGCSQTPGPAFFPPLTGGSRLDRSNRCLAVHAVAWHRLHARASFAQFQLTYARASGPGCRPDAGLDSPADEIARAACLQDEAGVFILQKSLRDTLDAAGAGYLAAGQDWPLLALVMPPSRPKPVQLSH
jgi:hypothetical protein